MKQYIPHKDYAWYCLDTFKSVILRVHVENIYGDIGYGHQLQLVLSLTGKLHLCSNNILSHSWFLYQNIKNEVLTLVLNSAKTDGGGIWLCTVLCIHMHLSFYDNNILCQTTLPICFLLPWHTNTSVFSYPGTPTHLFSLTLAHRYITIFPFNVRILCQTIWSVWFVPWISTEILCCRNTAIYREISITEGVATKKNQRCFIFLIKIFFTQFFGKSVSSDVKWNWLLG